MTNNATHDAALRLTASFGKFENEELVCEMIAALFPEDYDGNTIEELPGLVRSAREKRLGKQSVDYNYNHADIGPIPLGYTDNGLYVFLHQDKSILSVLSPMQLMSEPGLCDLAPMPWWVDHWPRVNAKGDVTGMDAKGIGNMLMEACRKTGPFISSRVRGSGIWREGSRVIENLRGPIPQSDQLTYIRFESLPEFRSDLEIDAGKLLSWFDHFQWSRPGLSTLLLGWAAIAPICGVLEWRPHIFINGPKHTGKSTLIDTLADLLYPMAIVVDGTSSEAGIRQSIGADSRPAILDEFESDRHLGRMKSVLKLARSASSAKGPIARGTPEGKALQFQIFSTFCFGAIIPIPGTSADASRIVELELEPHNDDLDIKAKIDEGRQHFKERRSVWGHQMIELINPILESVQIFEKKMPPGDLRHSANMAILLGAAFTALNKRPASETEAETMIAGHSELIHSLAKAHEEDDGQDCLNHLLCSKIGNHTVGDLIMGRAAISTPESGIALDDTNLILANYGIIMKGDGFLVANKHPELGKIYQPTLWADGAWKVPLRRLPGAKTDDQTRARFSGGRQTRCTFIPLSYLEDQE